MDKGGRQGELSRGRKMSLKTSEETQVRILEGEEEGDGVKGRRRKDRREAERRRGEEEERRENVCEGVELVFLFIDKHGRHLQCPNASLNRMK